MAKEITKEPDIIQSSAGFLRSIDEMRQRCIVFMQIRDDQVTAVQKTRLSFAIVKPR